MVAKHYPLKFRAANATEEKKMLKDLEHLKSGKVKAIRVTRNARAFKSKKNSFHPSLFSGFIVSTISVGIWLMMVNLDSFGWNYDIAYLFVLVGFSWALFSELITKRISFLKRLFISLIVITFLIFLFLTKFIETEKTSEDVFNNLSISIDSAASNNPLNSDIEITNNGKNDIQGYFIDWRFINQLRFSSSKFIVKNKMVIHPDDIGVTIRQGNPKTFNEELHAGGETKTTMDLTEAFEGNLGTKKMLPTYADLIIDVGYRIKTQPWLGYVKSKRFESSLENGNYVWRGQPTDINKRIVVDYFYYWRKLTVHK